MPRADRDAVQAAARAAALVFVVAWLFVEDVRAWLPFWLPLVLLAARRSSSCSAAAVSAPAAGPPPARSRARGRGPRLRRARRGRGRLPLRPAAPRPPRPRGRQVGWLVGAGVAAVASSRWRCAADRAATWQGALRGRARPRRGALPGRGAVGSPAAGAGPLRRRLRVHRRRERHARRRVPALAASPISTRRSAARCTTSRSATSAASAAAEAVVVLAHEAVHLGGERREGVTECLALQEAVPLAARLGLAERPRSRIAPRGLRASARRAERDPRRLRAPDECRDGGALDRQPGRRALPVGRPQPSWASSRSRTTAALEPPSCSPRTAEPSAFASVTIRSRSFSSVPRATKSAERSVARPLLELVEAAARPTGRRSPGRGGAPRCRRRAPPPAAPARPLPGRRPARLLELRRASRRDASTACTASASASRAVATSFAARSSSSSRLRRARSSSARRASAVSSSAVGLRELRRRVITERHESLALRGERRPGRLAARRPARAARRLRRRARPRPRAHGRQPRRVARARVRARGDRTPRVHCRSGSAVRGSYTRRMKTCGSCGTENPDIAKFCLACGLPLAEAGPAQETARS